MCDVFCLLHAGTNALLLWARWVKEGRDDSQIIPFHLLGDDATNSFREFAIKEEVLVGFGVFAKMTFAISKLPVGSLLNWVRMADEGILEGFNLVWVNVALFIALAFAVSSRKGTNVHTLVLGGVYLGRLLPRSLGRLFCLVQKRGKVGQIWQFLEDGEFGRRISYLTLLIETQRPGS